MLHGGIQPHASTTHHVGLRSTVEIPAGTVVWFPCVNCPTWTPAQRTLLPAEVDRRLDTWGHLLGDGSLLVPCAGAAMMNHSCAANVLDFGLDFGIAVADIPVDTEVTCDYSTFFADEGWSMRCDCGTPDCREVVAVADYTRTDLRRRWTEQIDEALRSASTVPQPLGPLLETWSETWRRVLAGVTSLGQASAGHSIVRPGFLAMRS
ncbi:SET domain-containing protein [Micromonospora humidisoli]|uniref:SET domain-containing protein n=1 Tax=Micromonospora sp. AKA109 TaxID=2733865 RepID=UPI0035B5F03B